MHSHILESLRLSVVDRKAIPVEDKVIDDNKGRVGQASVSVLCLTARRFAECGFSAGFLDKMKKKRISRICLWTGPCNAMLMEELFHFRTMWQGYAKPNGQGLGCGPYGSQIVKGLVGNAGKLILVQAHMTFGLAFVTVNIHIPCDSSQTKGRWDWLRRICRRGHEARVSKWKMLWHLWGYNDAWRPADAEIFLLWSTVACSVISVHRIHRLSDSFFSFQARHLRGLNGFLSSGSIWS